MLIKELRVSFRKAFNLFIVFLIVPIIYLVLSLFPGLNYFSIDGKDYLEVLLFFIWLITLLSSVFLGTSGFEYERRNDAFEYMLTFPFTKIKIITYKLFARLIILFVLISLFEFLYYFSSFFKKYSLFNPFYFPLICVLLFFLSFSFSLFEIRDLMALLVFFVYIGIFSLTFFLKRKGFYLEMAKIKPFFSSFAISLGVFAGISFSGLILTFKKFDISPFKKHLIRFLPYSLLPAFIGFLLNFIK